MSSPRRKRKPHSGEEESSPRASQAKKKKGSNSTQVTQVTPASQPKILPANIPNNPEFLTAALRLPEKYAALEKMFDTLDTACSLFHSRKQTLTMSRLQSSMELAGQHFTLAHLAQIVTICDSIQKNAFFLERRIISDRNSGPGMQHLIS